MNKPATPCFAAALLLAAQGRGTGIKGAIFDVDGVLTDGRLYFGAEGEVLKVFHVLDGLGLELLARAGIEVMVITGRDGSAMRRRLADLRVTRAAFGASDKLAAAQPLLAGANLAWDDVAVIGDDWPDLPLIDRCAFSCAPPGAHAEVLAAVDHVTSAAAGAGAAREFCDILLHASGRYADLLESRRLTHGAQA